MTWRKYWGLNHILQNYYRDYVYMQFFQLFVWFNYNFVSVLQQMDSFISIKINCFISITIKNGLNINRKLYLFFVFFCCLLQGDFIISYAYRIPLESHSFALVCYLVIYLLCPSSCTFLFAILLIIYYFCIHAKKKLFEL